MGRSQCSILAPGSSGIGFEGTTTIFGRRGRRRERRRGSRSPAGV